MARCKIAQPRLRFADVRWYRTREFPRAWQADLPRGHAVFGASFTVDSAIILIYQFALSDRRLREHELVHLVLGTPEWRDSSSADGLVHRLSQANEVRHPSAFFDPRSVCLPDAQLPIANLASLRIAAGERVRSEDAR